MDAILQWMPNNVKELLMAFKGGNLKVILHFLVYFTSRYLYLIGKFMLMYWILLSIHKRS